MTAPTEGRNYDWKTYTHPENDDVTVEAHIVTEDTRGDVDTPGMQRRTTVPGDVLVKTSHPNVYTVYSDRDWRDMGFADASAPVPSVQGEAADLPEFGEEDEELEPGVFDPSTRTAREVNEYLSRTDLTTEERERVERAEREGKNRSSAFPR